ncbi:sodium/proline symporter [Alteromonas sp. C1M14]|uniref:sodium/proline symporter n=1 Tax=Alteromonas sp. C1M14 TaxID=2841567 RepID=UPI001C091EAF|nr:sodium/proline symporter [Alteromonas sp. C1M14]MBU2980014.1 sodium/proline symporter [Alteromonas sp. C1M14]
METTILITLVCYKLLLLGVGLWAQKRTSNTTDFFLGGRQLGPIVASISYSASSASAWTLLGMSGLAYTIGLSAIWLCFGAILGAIFAWFWIAPRLMKHCQAKQQLTLTDFLADNAAPQEHLKIRRFATAITLFAFMFYISSQFQGAGNTFASTFSLNATESILLGSAIILTYTLLGGFWAVSVTDTLQGILMILAATLLPLAAWQAAGGWENIAANLATDEYQHLLSLTGKHTGLAAAGVVVGGLAVGLGTAGQPHLASRFMALRNERALLQARWIAVAWFAIVFLGMCALGLAGRVLMPELANPETLFFALTTELFPSVLGAILFAAVLSAIMSTADSMLLVSAACVAHDLGVEKRFPGKELQVSRGAMVFISVAAVILALYLPASIFNRALFAWIALGSAFGPILVIKLAGMSVSAQGVFRAMVCSFFLALALYWLPSAPGDIAERVIPFIVGFVILLLHRKHP